MIPYTQSNVDPGNCWQTAIACLVEVDPEFLPPQVEIEAFDHEVLQGWGSYRNVLSGYLLRHFSLLYSEYPVWEADALGARRFRHILIGPTVRTEKSGALHVVVGMPGLDPWDVHPSRAGLLEVQRVGVLLPALPAYVEMKERNWQQWEAEKKDSSLCALAVMRDCLCPVHDLDWAQQRAKRLKQQQWASMLRKDGA